MLSWEKVKIEFGPPYYEATLGNFYEKDDGVRFSIQFQPTNNLRGQYLVLIESIGSWPQFDEADQPARYYHSLITAQSEACCIAEAMLRARK